MPRVWCERWVCGAYLKFSNQFPYAYYWANIDRLSGQERVLFNEFNLEAFRANDIEFRAAVEGSGPLLILVHGWPESWYSWRHQIKPLAAAGYRVVTPDVRGYGGSDKPHAIDAYSMKSMMADILGIIDHFGEKQAVLIGHDWGAPICWNTAALHRDRVRAVAGLSVPYRKRGTVSGIELWKKLYADKFFYQVYFQEEGVAEAELELDVRTTLRKIYFSLSGDVSSLDDWLKSPPRQRLLDVLPDPEPFPDWLSSEDLDYYVDQFRVGGFRGPLNRYRNYERDFGQLPNMGVMPVNQPACFVAGSDDIVRSFVPDYDLYADVSGHCTDLRCAKIISGKGHWIQQEAPDEVNAVLLKFLRTLS